MAIDTIRNSAEQKDIFLKKLREQTAESHKKLEANAVSAALVQPQLSVETYGIYLEKLYGFVAPFERDIFPLLQAVIVDIEGRRKSRLLQSDIEIVSGNNAEAVQLINWKESHGEVISAMAAMYVLEGSTLGGNILYKKINANLGFDGQRGARYFAAYGPLTGKMWKEFLDLFTDYAVLNNCEEQIINSAVTAFSKIDAWFCINAA